MSFQSLMTQTCRIWRGREPEAVDAFGEERVEWDHVASVPCVVHNSSQYALLKLGIHSQVTHVIFCEYVAAMDADPRRRWRCDVDEAPGLIRAYMIVEPLDHMHRQHHLELGVRRLDDLPINGIFPLGIQSEEAVPS